jgi:hypothetical protein
MRSGGFQDIGVRFGAFGSNFRGPIFYNFLAFYYNI